jgi:hypothetical protein
MPVPVLIIIKQVAKKQEQQTMRQRQLGKSGLQVSALGLWKPPKPKTLEDRFAINVGAEDRD